MKILLVVDNSNIHVETKNKFGPGARFSYRKFEEKFYQNDTFIAKQMTGSKPPANDSFWNAMRQQGYEVTTYERKQTQNGSHEKGVDTAIVAKAIEVIINGKPDALVLLSGDLDMRPLIEMAKKYSCKIHLWSFRNSMSQELANICEDVRYIDDFLDDFIFFQDISGNIETLEEYRSKRVSDRIIESARNEVVISSSETDFTNEEEDCIDVEEESNCNNETETLFWNAAWPTWKKALVGTGYVLLSVVALLGIGCLVSDSDDTYY